MTLISQPTTRRADDIAKLPVFDEGGKRLEVGSLWHDHTAVLVFLRHFGCIHCRDHVVHLHRRQADFDKAKATLSVIGNGSPSFIAGFREQTLFDGPVYTDPTLALYRAAELKRGIAATLDPRSLFGAARALASGIRQGRTQGDQWQQGGVLVVSPGNQIRWQHASNRPGDNASADQILAAL